MSTSLQRVKKEVAQPLSKPKSGRTIGNRSAALPLQTRDGQATAENHPSRAIIMLRYDSARRCHGRAQVLAESRRPLPWQVLNASKHDQVASRVPQWPHA